MKNFKKTAVALIAGVVMGILIADWQDVVQGVQDGWNEGGQPQVHNSK